MAETAPPRIWAKVHGHGVSASAAGSIRYLVGTFADRKAGARDKAVEYVRADLVDELLTAREARGRAEMREEAARYHDRHVRALREACDLAWSECTPDIGLHALGIHEQSAAAIRSLPTQGETK